MTQVAGPPFVLGLAGGVGSGKSTVAREFARRGFVVIDYDAEAKAALERPEVRARLVEWWGGEVIGADGAVDRRVVADRVFHSEADRLRLEGLIHPLVRRTNQEARQLALAAGVPGVMMDAPLLFEAGLDKECDAVVFVEASRATRLARVRATRGWDEAEFDRREAAQWPLDRKRQASRFVIHNDEVDGSSRRLAAQVGEVCAILEGRAGTSEPRTPGSAGSG